MCSHFANVDHGGQKNRNEKTIVVLYNLSASFYCVYFFNIVRHHIIFIFNTERPIPSPLFWGWSVATKFESLSEMWLFEALHTAMHVHASNFNTAWSPCSRPWSWDYVIWFLQTGHGNHWRCCIMLFYNYDNLARSTLYKC